ncbi:L-lactate dehydrogenase complex protein LldG [Rhizobiales bacterium GAS191]|jgi:L-lactate dehydrogenase complex protein LldG|nr:L-lactate dehydrogenase complex protein LldG [Rhizobiales bacterium GAS113]SEE23130.1 L-lactate dehydrogenase complex protein LldG [Rhizobiales bacterium GAS191]SEE33180.1 L-lactate dehydrogenase complex protein LldG [Rhizobiales bacterium GAS188]
MSSARDDILATMRRSLGVSGTEAPRRAAVEDRLARAPKGVIPKRAEVTGAECLELFKRQAEEALATVAVVADAAAVPQEAARYLRDANLPATLRMGADARLAAMPWEATALDIAKGASAGRDLNALSHAFAGVAETGTLALVSGPDNPTTLNFLPDNHIVVVAAKDLAGSYEESLDRLRSVYGKGAMPRSLNLITGPSRSADIEQTLILGAHGPRKLHIIVVEG